MILYAVLFRSRSLLMVSHFLSLAPNSPSFDDVCTHDVFLYAAYFAVGPTKRVLVIMCYHDVAEVEVLFEEILKILGPGPDESISLTKSVQDVFAHSSYRHERAGVCRHVQVIMSRLPRPYAL